MKLLFGYFVRKFGEDVSESFLQVTNDIKWHGTVPKSVYTAANKMPAFLNKDQKVV